MEELTCAVNDAVSIGEALQKLNFEVVVMENTELDTLIEAISALEQKIREYEAILVFFESSAGRVGSAKLRGNPLKD
jgi:hypothetical protein